MKRISKGDVYWRREGRRKRRRQGSGEVELVGGVVDRGEKYKGK